MTASAPIQSSGDFRQGLRDAIPVAFGYVPLGISYGMFAVSVGLPWWWVTITALVIYAGSMEFLAAGMLVGAAPVSQAATTTLFVNSRHIFYGLSVPLERIRNPFARFYGIHALTDEAYAVCAGIGRDNLTGPRILGISIASHFYWVLGSTVGAIFATMLPFDLSFMGFAMTSLFAILAINAAKVSREWGLFGAAAIIGILAMMFVKDAMLLVGLLVYFVLVVAMVLVRRKRAAA
ncbi:MAG: AzlC family ABC transporter permease [Gulosibacter sp.]|uniref:AzlC family ABC transporter permease n=1 Tax=Gulosibacter sp. TaxID=2817531 RepID=UPI003F921F1B